MTHSILIYLDQDLQMWQVPDNSKTKPILFEEMWREGKVLHLAKEYKEVWSKHWTAHIKQAHTIYVVVGSRAGFTDTRMVYIWAKSNNMFKGIPFFVYQTSQELELDEYSIEQWSQLTKTCKKEGVQTPIYNAEARVGGR